MPWRQWAPKTTKADCSSWAFVQDRDRLSQERHVVPDSSCSTTSRELGVGPRRTADVVAAGAARDLLQVSRG